MATTPNPAWRLLCTGSPFPLRDLAVYALLLDETCRTALRVGQREEADLTDADQAALVVRLAAIEVGRAGKAGWIAAATKAADPFINVTFPAGSAGSVAMPSLTCNGPSAILIEAVRHLGAKVDAGHIEIDTARIAEVLARFP